LEAGISLAISPAGVERFLAMAGLGLAADESWFGWRDSCQTRLTWQATGLAGKERDPVSSGVPNTWGIRLHSAEAY